jgi:ABC-2 type transport system permease protein
MEITTILWREWLFLKRRFWRVTFSQMVSPLLYFITFGMGLGRVMEMDGRPYLYYLIPGLLAMTTMRNSYTSVSTRISVMRLHEKSFECYLYSPTRMHLLAMGHILAGALRGMYSGVFIVLLGIVSGHERVAFDRGYPEFADLFRSWLSGSHDDGEPLRHEQFY